MVNWYEAEEAMASDIIEVDVSAMKFEENGKIKKTLAIKDLSNREIRLLQISPELEHLSGTLDTLSPKSHTMGLLITYQRMFKGAGGNLPFTFENFLNWRSSRSNKLMELFKEAIGDVEKKPEDLPSPTQDKPSEMP